MSEKIHVLKELKQHASGKVENNVSLFLNSEDAYDKKNELADSYKAKDASIETENDHYHVLIDKYGTKITLSIQASQPVQINKNPDTVMTNMSKEDILRSFYCFEDLCQALDSCFDLHDLGYADEITQKNYEELSEYKALQLWSDWKTAHGRELY